MNTLVHSLSALAHVLAAIAAVGASALPALAQSEIEPNDTAATANPIASPQGTLLNVTGSLSSLTDLDYYVFTTTITCSIRIETDSGTPGVCPSPLDTQISLLAANGVTQIATDDDGGVLNCSLLNPLVAAPVRNLPAGTYYVRVKSYSGASGVGPYGLRISQSEPPQPLGNGFVYQGVVRNGSTPITGTADLRFSLWYNPTSSSSQVGSTLESSAVALSGGLLTTTLDFGALAFDGNRRWLQVETRYPAGSGSYIAMTPRQEITLTPMADYARAAAVAATALTADSATSAASATSAGSALYATSAGSADAAPWSGLTGAPTVALTSGNVLRVTGGTDASLTAGGYFTLGATTGANLHFDDNEIMARSNGAAATLTINNNGGQVTIGGASGGTSTLFVNGTATKPGGGSWTASSDLRLKHDITGLEGSLNKLLALRGVSFVYNDPEKIGELPGRRIGMIAQEVEGVFPDWVATGSHGYKTLTFRGFEALTVEALRDLRTEKDAQIDALKARVARLERLIEQMAEKGARP